MCISMGLVVCCQVGIVLSGLAFVAFLSEGLADLLCGLRVSSFAVREASIARKIGVINLPKRKPENGAF